MEDKLKKSIQHIIFIGLFLVLSSSSFIQCSQKEKSQISEEEWAALPADGPYLSAYERIICSNEATKSELYAAREFQRLFKEFTGKELTIEGTDSQSGKSILIGAEAAADLQFNTEKLGEERN